MICAALVGDYLTTLGADIKQDKAIFQRLGRWPTAERGRLSAA